MAIHDLYTYIVSSPYNSQARARFQKQAAITAEPKERVDILVHITMGCGRGLHEFGVT